MPSPGRAPLFFFMRTWYWKWQNSLSAQRGFNVNWRLSLLVIGTCGNKLVFISFLVCWQYFIILVARSMFCPFLIHLRTFHGSETGSRWPRKSMVFSLKEDRHFSTSRQDFAFSWNPSSLSINYPTTRYVHISPSIISHITLNDNWQSGC